MKRKSKTLWLAAFSLASLTGAPLILTGADSDGDNQLSSNRNNSVSPAAEAEPGKISTVDNDKLTASNRDQAQAQAKAQDTEKHDIVSLAASNRDLEKFVTAMQAAGLTQTLQGEGPYTVFAPSDNAFAKLDNAAWEELMRPENQAKLSEILTYHIVPGAVESKNLQAGDYATLQGSPLTAVVSEKDMMVNEGKIVEKDIVASNGIIHIIDTVLTPPPPVAPMSDPMSSVDE